MILLLYHTISSLQEPPRISIRIHLDYLRIFVVICSVISERKTVMEKYIPYNKLSKKRQRKLNKTNRGNWNGSNPVTHKPENPRPKTEKAQNRKLECGSDSVPFHFLYRFPSGQLQSLSSTCSNSNQSLVRSSTISHAPSSRKRWLAPGMITSLDCSLIPWNC